MQIANGGTVPRLGGPLIFNLCFVDAITNGPISQLICLGLLVPIKICSRFKITDTERARSGRI